MLPAAYENGTIFVEPVTVDGRRLRFYTDTGGGDWISRPEAVGLGLVPGAEPGAESGAESGAEPRTEPGAERPDGPEAWARVAMPEFADAAWIPSPDASGTILLNPDPADPSDSAGTRAGRPPLGRSGLLGQRWFADRIWELDYPAERLVLHDEPPPIVGTRARLGFPEVDGRRGANFPRISVRIDDEPFELLLDTGAHTALTAAGLDGLGRVDGPDRVDAGGGRAAVRATSFVIASVVRRWRARHPDWPVVEGAERRSGARMIRVPRVEVRGVPEDLPIDGVWFTERADPNFLTFMSQWMDRTIVGALGGNAFGRLRLLLDYPSAVAVFSLGSPSPARGSGSGSGQ